MQDVPKPSSGLNPDAAEWLLHVVFCLLPLLLVLGVLYAVLGGDTEVNLFFRNYREGSPNFTLFMRVFTEWGNSVFYALYAVLLWVGWRRGNVQLVRLVLAYAFVQVVVSAFLLRIVKISIGRPRPQAEGFSRPFSAWHPAYQSMPSGHTTEVIISCLPLSLYIKKYAFSAFAGLYTAVMGFSRIYIDMHYPSDVLAGMLAGVFGAWVVLCLQKSAWGREMTDRVKNMQKHRRNTPGGKA